MSELHEIQGIRGIGSLMNILVQVAGRPGFRNRVILSGLNRWGGTLGERPPATNTGGLWALFEAPIQKKSEYHVRSNEKAR